MRILTGGGVNFAFHPFFICPYLPFLLVKSDKILTPSLRFQSRFYSTRWDTMTTTAAANPASHLPVPGRFYCWYFLLGDRDRAIVWSQLFPFQWKWDTVISFYYLLLYLLPHVYLISDVALVNFCAQFCPAPPFSSRHLLLNSGTNSGGYD